MTRCTITDQATCWCGTSRTRASRRRDTRGPPAKWACAARPRVPGATNLVTGLVDAMMDSIPVVAITGQVSTKLIGSDAFQEADTFGITRSCTKHNFLVKTLADLPQAIHEAFHIAATRASGSGAGGYSERRFSGPGPLFAGFAIHLPGYKVYTEGHAGQIRRAAQMIWEAKRPFVYAGGGIVAADASEELADVCGTGGCCRRSAH